MSAGAPAGPVLRDIHLPPAPSWWPPAPGWWLLAAIVVALCAVLGIYAARIARRRRHRRRVLRELEGSIAPARSDPAALATSLSRFLRRLSREAHADAASMPGERWLAWLDRCVGSDEFSRGIGRVLVEAPYRRAMDYDAAALIALVRRCTRRVLEGGHA